MDEYVTVAQVKSEIAAVYYFNGLEAVKSGLPATHPEPTRAETLKCMTICVIVLRNGFTVTGQSVCADPANYNEQDGREYAYRKAEDKIWPYLGYELRTELSKGEV